MSKRAAPLARTGRRAAWGVALLASAACSPATHGDAQPLEGIRVPPGFRIGVYAAGVRGARSMALGDRGTLFVGTIEEGVVYAITDADHDGRAERVATILEGADMPNGVAFRDGDLYVAEVSRVVRLEDIESRLDDPPPPTVVRDDFPNARAHGWKYLRFGPDGMLYVPVGFPCNVCLPDDPIFGTITRMKPDGSDREIFASGIRNTVGFDWSPRDGVLWFTDNGRDWLGDNSPPDELNRAPRPGLHFGFPFCHGGTIPDPEFGSRASCDEFEPPVADLGPHVAALGMRFYTGSMFPEPWRGRIFVAEHGSWNRSQKIGYRVVTVEPDGNGRAGPPEVFAEGWLHDGSVSGRPVDVLVLPDGSLLVSDDYAGAIYRVTYIGKE
ncbi:MAG: sorbosone dehydrogenase family protein [Candidatus Eisenbacteria bacterium]